MYIYSKFILIRGLRRLIGVLKHCNTRVRIYFLSYWSVKNNIIVLYLYWCKFFPCINYNRLRITVNWAERNNDNSVIYVQLLAKHKHYRDIYGDILTSKKHLQTNTRLRVWDINVRFIAKFNIYKTSLWRLL